MTADLQDFVYMLENNEGESVASRLVEDGQARLLDLDHPCVSRLNCGSMQGVGVQFYNENGDVDTGVQLKDYHYFLDENNKIRPIPPGSILQGWFNKETTKNSQEANSSTSRLQPENTFPNIINSEVQTSKRLGILPVSQITPTSESTIETYPSTSAEEGGSYYESLAQVMDIELEEEIISCDTTPHKALAQKALVQKTAKAPPGRRGRKKKFPNADFPKTPPSDLLFKHSSEQNVHSSH